MIRETRILDFRSFRDVTIGGIGNFLAIAGRNGSGKSNVLRALNLFFNGEVEKGIPLNLSRDFHRSTERKDKKVVRVEVDFELPTPPFHWRRGVSEHAVTLGINEGRFQLAREWSLDPDTGTVRDRFYLRLPDAQWSVIPQDHLGFINLFLTRLIRFRYVPNHIHPVTLIDNERAELQRALMTRLNRRQAGDVDLEAPLQAMAGVAAEVIEPVTTQLIATAPEIQVATIATPVSWADIALTLDLELQQTGQSARSALLHGSGHQSLVALSMLRLIDTDFSSSFGWHQASIWGLEEPEAYLHHELAYNVGRLLAQFSEHDRFQIAITTHSPTMMAFADTGLLVGSGGVSVHSAADLIQASAASGVGPYVHPLLMNESKPLLLVEGRTDRQHLENAYAALNRHKPWSIAAIEDLDIPEGVEGFRHLVRQHGRPLSARNPNSPVVVLVDHNENAQTINERLQALHPRSSAHRWDGGLANPDLDLTEFRGIEAYLSTELLDAADAAGFIRLMRPAARTPIGCRNGNKVAIAQLGTNRGQRADYVFFEPMLNYLESQLAPQPMLVP